MNKVRDQGHAIFRLAGTNIFHFVRLRIYGDKTGDCVDFFGVQAGPWAFLWTNPFAGEK